jgi:hypothetical protein
VANLTSYSRVQTIRLSHLCSLKQCWRELGALQPQFESYGHFEAFLWYCFYGIVSNRPSMISSACIHANKTVEKSLYQLPLYQLSSWQSSLFSRSVMDTTELTWVLPQKFFITRKNFTFQAMCCL